MHIHVYLKFETSSSAKNNLLTTRKTKKLKQIIDQRVQQHAARDYS